MSAERKAAAVFGALVADAAALGLHWVYDPARIKAVADAHGGGAFVPVDPAHHEGVPAYFAHALRCDGMQSQYGEVLRLVMQSILDHDGFDGAAYRAAFVAHFGAGGRYQGYIDRPTRGVLENTAAEKEVTGIDDDQLPATSTLPAIVARYGGDAQVSMAKAAREVTNINDVAEGYAAVCAAVLNGVIEGGDLKTVLKVTAQEAEGEIGEALRAALGTDEVDSVAYGEVTGRACHLPMAVPLAFHILSRAEDYADAVEQNIRAGGDSCGRAIIIGSIMAAACGVRDIPLDWILKLDRAESVWDQCRTIAH
ncbi:ADP-ribosylglycohydrolase family protein [Amylibacter sp. IMCC11727]|uniref:ADP-ribosylglycohydrolase family protein n=1 Tax=Amylibacter sp. IMCC11727 TaxID=3039851 RepID=UPI00244E32D5|nr:ADP-ribosylglycohydrolase family protein [Amylibacter sp. IMCC11727]WGI21350.1 ADP-ribosylglycohydrolase family protein [Amylibacter sp. IMCC11727]